MVVLEAALRLHVLPGLAAVRAQPNDVDVVIAQCMQVWRNQFSMILCLKLARIFREQAQVARDDSTADLLTVDELERQLFSHEDAAGNDEDTKEEQRVNRLLRAMSQLRPVRPLPRPPPPAPPPPPPRPVDPPPIIVDVSSCIGSDSGGGSSSSSSSGSGSSSSSSDEDNEMPPLIEA